MKHNYLKRLLVLLVCLAAIVMLVPSFAVAQEQTSEAAAAIQTRIDAVLDSFGITDDMTDDEIADAIIAADGATIEAAAKEMDAIDADAADQLTEADLTQMDIALYERFCNIWDQLFTPALMTDVNMLDSTLLISDTKNTGSGSGTTYTATVQSSGFLSSTRGTNTVTITNKSGATATLSFNYSATNIDTKSDGYRCTIDGTERTGGSGSASGYFEKSLDAGASITIKFTSVQLSSTKATLTLTNVSLVTAAEKSEVTVNFDSSVGSVTVAGADAASGSVHEMTADGATLVATPVSGATFLGWIEDGKLKSDEATYTLKPTGDMTIEAAFASASTDAWFLVNNSYWTDDLNDADEAAAGSGTIVLAADGTLPAGDYEISSGVTLLIPYDAANTLCTEKPAIIESYTTPSVYRMLTMASGAHIAVNGAISVSGQQYCSRPIGAVSGKYGVIEMAEGSSITVNDGGFLYAWGYIAGVKGSNTTVSEGTVTIESGGTVYEDFQIVDWRGGTATTTMISDETVFPMSQYYVQNVQVPMTLKSGATENTFTSVKVTLAGIQDAPVTFIGEGGMFVLDENTSVIKDYNEATDRLTLELVQGSISLGSVKMEVRVSTVGGKIDINSANFVLPLNNNITIIANSDTTLSAANDVAMLPGSEMILKEGSNFNITSGSYYIYDLDEWTYDTTSADMITKLDGNTYNNGGYCSEYNWVMAAAPYAHDRIKTRTAADLKDAEVKVDGTITVSDGAYVYTTAGGANVYSTGTGKIEFKGAPGTATTTYQAVATIEDRTGVAYVDIPITSAKLKNADGSYVATADESGTYTYYASTGRWDRPSHFYEAVVTPPTCTDAGFTTYTCSVCGDSYSETITATGHSYTSDTKAPTCTEGGYTTHTCSCGHKYVDTYTDPQHTYPEGSTTCSICGLGEDALTIDYVSLSMENSLEMNFAFLKSGISDPSGCYVKFTKVNEDGKTTATTKAYDTWKSVTIGDKEYWYAVYSGLAAKEMSDMVYAGVYDSSNNLISQVKADSIQTQAMRNLETAKDKTLTRTMVVDMLNYGAAAQQKFNYHTNNLANSQLTDEQKAWATASVAYEDTSKAPEGYQANVKLESNIQFMIAILGLKDSMNVEITFHDHYGTDKSYTLENITIESDDGYFYHTVEQTVIADAWEDITITVKDGETVVATITDNIASYAARAMNKTGNELYEMIVKFSHSAKAYLHDKYNITEG